MTTAVREKLRKELYVAFLKSAVAMGNDLKQLSWFGRNHAHRNSKMAKPLKKAA